MGPRYLKPGEDFGESHFAEMGLNYRDPSPPYNNPVGRSTHSAYAKGGATPKKTKAIIAVVTPSKPPKAPPAREKVKGALQAAAAIGALAGARKRPAPPMFSDGGLADMQIPAPKYGSEASETATGLKKGGHLTTSQRHHMPKKSFALPGHGKGPEGKGAGSYPIPDVAHGRNALARVAQHGTPSEQAKVRAAVHKKFPQIGKRKG